MAVTKRSIYFDACCFIDLAARATGHPVDSWKSDHVHWCRKLLDASRDGVVQVYTSAFSIVECLGVHDVDRNLVMTDEVQRLFKAMLLSGTSGVLPIQPSPLVFERARDLVWRDKLNLKGPDALHLASALFVGCRDFVTTDRKTIGKAANIKKLKKLGLAVVKGGDVANVLPDEYRQSPLSPMTQQ